MSRTPRQTRRTTRPAEPRWSMLHLSPKPEFRADELAPWNPWDNAWLAGEVMEEGYDAACIHRTCWPHAHEDSMDCPCCPVVLTLEEIRMPDWIDKAQSAERTN